MSAILVGTSEVGEISPSLRRRCRRIYGRLVAEGDAAQVRRIDKSVAKYLTGEIPRFKFLYQRGAMEDGPRFLPVEAEDVPFTEPEDVELTRVEDWHIASSDVF